MRQIWYIYLLFSKSMQLSEKEKKFVNFIVVFLHNPQTSPLQVFTDFILDNT